MEDDSFDPVQFHFLKMKKELHVVKSLSFAMKFSAPGSTQLGCSQKWNLVLIELIIR